MPHLRRYKEDIRSFYGRLRTRLDYFAPTGLPRLLLGQVPYRPQNKIALHVGLRESEVNMKGINVLLRN